MTMEYEQNGGSGPLGDGAPGQKVRERLQKAREGSPGPDLGQDGGMMESLSVPDEPGPAVAGRTPLVGTLRRSNDMPVIRDQLDGVMG